MAIKLEVLENVEEVHKHFARSIADEIKEKNKAGKMTRLILPVGPVKHYPFLAKITNEERISWKNVWAFNMDEYLDWQGRVLSKSHPLSFRGFMENFYNSIEEELRIPEEQAWFPEPNDIDAISEKIKEVGGIDTCYGGIGCHGHVAFNEPPISRFYQVSSEEFAKSLTRIVPLAPETIVMNSTRSLGGNFSEFPPMAITLGMQDILNAKRIRLYGDGGEWQKTAIKEAIKGKKRIEYPVTLLQDHPDVIIYADSVSAADAI